MVHSATVLAILLAAAPLAGYVPLPALSAVLVVVALNVGEWHNVAALPGWLPGDASVFLLSLMLTVLTDVATAVEAGLALSLILYVARVNDAARVEALPSATNNVLTMRLHGPLLFGGCSKLEASSEPLLALNPRVLVLDCAELSSLDGSALHSIEHLHKRCEHAGTELIFSGLHSQPRALVVASGLAAALGARNIVRGAVEADARSSEVLAGRIM
jgi:SulP family sulfate permease